MSQNQYDYAKRLASYIKDDRAIVAHMKREFGAVWTLEEVARLRRRECPRVYTTRIIEPSTQGEEFHIEQMNTGIELASRKLARKTREHHGKQGTA